MSGLALLRVWERVGGVLIWCLIGANFFERRGREFILCELATRFGFVADFIAVLFREKRRNPIYLWARGLHRTPQLKFFFERRCSNGEALLDG